MCNRGLSPKSIKSYLYGIKRLIKFINKDLQKVTLKEISAFQYHMNSIEEYSWTTYNITTCAMRFFYRYTCRKKWTIERIPFGRREKFIPVVLSHDEVILMFQSAQYLKFKTMMITAYATGMRINEIRHLKKQDIDRERGVIRVRCGKGSKQREVPLSPILLKYLYHFWRIEGKEMKEYLFFKKRNPSQPIDESWVQKNVRRACLKSGINKKDTMHTFRHTFATHLLENGAKFIQIKKLLGHSCLKTTLKYVHVIQESFIRIKSPLDF